MSSQTAFDITKLDRTARVVGACGLLAFVNSFLPWYKASAEGVQFYSANAWKVHYAWIPMLALLALSVAIALPAFGRSLLPADKIPLIVAGVGLACVVFVLIRWFTYPTANALGFSAGAAFGTYVGLILSVVVTVFGFLADSGPEGMAARIVAAFGRRPG